ncbi:hypothetical protein OGAPHI_005914 [Ogataea philodendri]|uniref:Uncharacterized protein n=1 Tax=Ogataea philodendri TaxID=1378263 RepID=A0A9P8NYT7_9ASCO|nr:uncharacterized protein OGAPHI_005914 [Ogataea philodendri]KAH3661736.1 hypothetical protein OGAPHI_005914 [Ogataea philodendri]
MEDLCETTRRKDLNATASWSLSFLELKMDAIAASSSERMSFNDSGIKYASLFSSVPPLVLRSLINSRSSSVASTG